MATWRPENSMLTQRGVEILNKLKAGVGSITVTRIVSGSKRVPESLLFQQTTISGVQKQMTISSKNTTDTGSEIAFYIENKDFTEPYELHQIGIYVTHPDYVGEQLYHISQCDADDYDTIPAISYTLVTQGYSIFMEHGNSSSVNITVDPSGMVNEVQFNEFKESINYSITYLIENSVLNNEKGVANGVATLDKNGKVLYEQLPSMDYVHTSEKGVANGVATLDKNGKVLYEQLPDMNYESQGTSESMVKTHNENEKSHPYLLEQVGNCARAAQNAQNAADEALEALASIAYTIKVVPTQNGTLTYTGSSQSPSWNSYNPDTMTLGGVTSGIEAGTYVATFTPKDKYKWYDDTTEAKEVVWTIGKASIGSPVQSGTLTYNGSAQSPSWSNYDSAKMTLSGTTSATNAGSYTATFTPGTNYKWSDGTNATKNVTWTIGKAAGSLTLDKTSVELKIGSLTSTITATRSGDGTVSAVSSNTSVATVSVSGNVITITGNNTGSATITVSVAAGTNYTAPTSKTCSVTANLSRNLNDSDWATIRSVSDSGKGANYWSVGDTKTITINGKVGNTTFSNLSINAFILGFNHNSSKEGNNRIHFQIGKIGTKDVCLCDSNYGKSGSSSSYFQMNIRRGNSGGWNGSSMRGTLLGNNGTPSNPTSGSLMAALPTDLLAVMKSVAKYTDNTGGSSSTSGAVTATTDYLFLLAEFEVQGDIKYANQYEQNYQAQYDYYKAGNSRTKYKHNGTTRAANWWCRSASYNDGDTNGFCYVSVHGNQEHNYANYSYGLAPGFAI